VSFLASFSYELFEFKNGNRNNLKILEEKMKNVSIWQQGIEAIRKFGNRFTAQLRIGTPIVSRATEFMGKLFFYTEFHRNLKSRHIQQKRLTARV